MLCFDKCNIYQISDVNRGSRYLDMYLNSTWVMLSIVISKSQLDYRLRLQHDIFFLSLARLRCASCSV